MEHIIPIDCAGFETPAQLHAAFAAALEFPAHYGHNLDALFDCLTDISRETGLRLLHWDAAEARLGSKFRRVILTAARENPNLSVSFD